MKGFASGRIPGTAKRAGESSCAGIVREVER
jgi:hypothetical protein